MTGKVDFPCPADELSAAHRKIGKDLVLYDKTGKAHGEVAQLDKLEGLADTNNRRRRRIYLLNWADSDNDWLLLEDKALVEN